MSRKANLWISSRRSIVSNAPPNLDKSDLLKDVLAFVNSWRRTTAYVLIGVREVKGRT